MSSEAGPASLMSSSKEHWDTLVETHGRLAEVDVADSGEEGSGGAYQAGGGGSTRLRILESRLQWYQAELDTAKATVPVIPPQTIKESVAAVEHEVATGFVGSAEALQRAQDRLLLLEDQIVYERHLQEQHREMAAALEAKIDEAKDAADEHADSQQSGRASGGGSAATSSEQRQLGARNKTMMDALNEFLENHYPRPTPSDAASATAGGGGGKRSKQGDISQFLAAPSQLLSMSEILEELMNVAISKPHAPYVVLDDTYWEPYIELLVRWGIGLKHPQHSNQVKLVAFHI